jgi:hypothetical protein
VCPKSSLGLANFVVEFECPLFSPSIKEKGVLSRAFLKKSCAEIYKYILVGRFVGTYFPNLFKLDSTIFFLASPLYSHRDMHSH